MSVEPYDGPGSVAELRRWLEDDLFRDDPFEPQPEDTDRDLRILRKAVHPRLILR